MFNFPKKKSNTEIEVIRESIDKAIVKTITKEKWIEVYGYKGLNDNMTANISEEFAITYQTNGVYKMADESLVMTGFKGYHLSSELVGTFEKFDPFKHCKYFKVRAIVKEEEWNKLISGKSMKDSIAAKEIELLEEVIINYETIINRYDFHRENPICMIKNIFNTEEKWVRFYNDKSINLHAFIINENFNILKNSKCMFSDSMISLILKKIENVTINRYKGINDLNQNIIIYDYVKKIIDLRVIDNIPKEIILELLCKKNLF